MLPPQAFGTGVGTRAAALAASAGPASVVAGVAYAGALGRAGVVPDHVVGGGAPWPADEEALRDWLVGSADPSPLPGPAGDGEDLEDRIRALHDAGVRVFVAAGPGQELTAVVDRVLTGRPHEAIPLDLPGEHGLIGWLGAVARLAVSGVTVDLAALHAGRDTDPARWEDPAGPPGWIVNGHFVRTAAGQPLPKGLRPAHAAPTLALGTEPATPAPAPAVGVAASLSDGELAVVTEYLRILQGMVAAGSEIVRHAAAEGRT
jgi:hypothetical protein